MAGGPDRELNLNCPIPSDGGGRVMLAHGGGMRLTSRLLDEIFLPAFANEALAQRHDGALLALDGRPLAFTTDSYVVRPLFFPGGDIGDLAVYGTVNDLAMCGARPLWLSASFILEEGFAIEALRTIAESMRRAAARAGVAIVTGDTKVVERGRGDGVFITTSGVGAVEIGGIGPARVEPGDAILVSGDLGAHGITILAAREGLGLETTLQSDAAPLWEPVEALIREGLEIHCLRDLTRGGLAAALHEISAARGLELHADEAAIPVSDPVRGACELLGLDPLYVANEGRFCVILPELQAARALDLLRSHEVSRGAVRAGTVTAETKPRVILHSRIGGRRVLDLPSGEQLPRIC
jgi:hydrogenase expression/formation protein HypE